METVFLMYAAYKDVWTHARSSTGRPINAWRGNAVSGLPNMTFTEFWDCFTPSLSLPGKFIPSVGVKEGLS